MPPFLRNSALKDLLTSSHLFPSVTCIHFSISYKTPLNSLLSNRILARLTVRLFTYEYPPISLHLSSSFSQTLLLYKLRRASSYLFALLCSLSLFSPSKKLEFVFSPRTTSGTAQPGSGSFIDKIPDFRLMHPKPRLAQGLGLRASFHHSLGTFS